VAGKVCLQERSKSFKGSGKIKRREIMRKMLCGLLATLVLGNVSFADETAFNVKLPDAKGKQVEARLLFSDENKNIAVRVADHEFVAVPYEQLDKFSYEYTKKHRITEGALVMVASLGAGAIVMLTKSKSHWLYIDYREQNVPKSVVLRMDKNDYKKIIEAVKTHTGKDVEMLGDKKDKSKKQESKDKGKDVHATQ
jgi:hypothetical protein